MPKKDLKVKIFLDTFEDQKTKELVTFTRYQTEIEDNVFDLYPIEESKRLLKYLYDKNEYFAFEEEKTEELKVVQTTNGTEFCIILFNKTFKLVPKKNDLELLEYLVQD